MTDGLPHGDHRADGTPATVRREFRFAAPVAAGAGVLFQRTPVDGDPLVRPQTPRYFFEDAPPMHSRPARTRCMRMHSVQGPGRGHDAEPECVERPPQEDGGGTAGEPVSEEGTDSHASPAPWGRRLFTSLFVEERGGQKVYAFGAIIAENVDEAIGRLRDRRGDDHAEHAILREGFDAGSPLATTLLSTAIVEMLSQIASNPMSPIADGLEVMVEQRFAA